MLLKALRCKLEVHCRLRLNRRFIVVEGISQNLGDVAPLDEIFKLKERFKYRLVLDESLSFGVLGKTGRGAAEHFGLMPGQVEIVAASMGMHVLTVTIVFTGAIAGTSAAKPGMLAGMLSGLL